MPGLGLPNGLRRPAWVKKLGRDDFSFVLKPEIILWGATKQGRESSPIREPAWIEPQMGMEGVGRDGPLNNMTEVSHRDHFRRAERDTAALRSGGFLKTHNISDYSIKGPVLGSQFRVFGIWLEF